MFVKYNLDDIKNGIVVLDEESQKEDLLLIINSFETNGGYDISEWNLFEIAKSSGCRVYGLESMSNLVYIKLNENNELIPCYFKNHDSYGYSEFEASSIEEAISLYENYWNPIYRSQKFEMI